MDQTKYVEVEQNEQDEEIDESQVPYWTSYRVSLSLFVAFGMGLLYALRINMSIAIVCMTGSAPPVNDNSTWHIQNGTGIPNITIDGEGNCLGDQSQNTDVFKQGEFDWNKQLKGYILSSLYYGYIMTQFVGGWIAGRVGGKRLFGTGMLLAIIANLLIPVGARLNVYLLIALRFIMGFTMGVSFPATHTLWSKWAPPLERSKLIVFSYAGNVMGTVVAMGVSGLLCDIQVNNGWPFVFYVFGGIGLLWWLAWTFLVYESPAVHPRISKIEREYIQEKIGPSAYAEKITTPWKDIFRSPPVYAVIVGHTCNNWGWYTLLTSIPMYMKEVLQFNIKSNGLYNAIPYMCMWVTTIAVSQIADQLRTRRILSTTAVRKLCQCVAEISPGILVIIMGYMGCDQRMTAVALLALAVSCVGFGKSGYHVNHVDIAPRFAGLLIGITNTMATIPGFVSPTVVGFLTTNGTQEEWQKVFYITAAIYIFGAIFFVIFASGEEQQWAKVADCKQDDIKLEQNSVNAISHNPKQAVKTYTLKSSVQNGNRENSQMNTYL